MSVEEISMEEEFEKDDDSSSNVSNSPEGLSEEEEIDEEKISAVQDQVNSNPFAYELHLQLVTLLRKSGELDRLRNAREEMSKLFPLTPELWLDWITDESKLTVSEAEHELLINLFERAVKDYTSVSIWLEYAQFSIGGMGIKGGIENVRRIFERALTVVGLHVTQGSLIWEAYREFENAMLSSIQPPGSSPQPEVEEQLNQQKNKILSLFRRQLSVPLFDMERTYEEYLEWLDEDTDHSLEHLYQKARTKLEKLKPYEDALLASEAPHLEEYKQYINFEMKEGDPARIQIIYERALVENCLIPDLWQQYTKYLDRQLKIDSIVLPVHERAVRNCPWSMCLWISYVQAQERYNQSHDKVKETFERALQAGFTQGEEYRQLWLAYLDYLRRRIIWNEDHISELEELKIVFQRATDHIMTYFKDSDPQCLILQYWAKVEAKYCKDIGRARELWNSILNHGHNAEAEMWLQYANFERLYGDDKHYRKILIKGLFAASDWPETIGDVLLNFEREEGSLETLDNATEKYENQIKRIQERRQKIAEKDARKQKHETEYRKQARAEKKAAKLAAIRGQRLHPSKISNLDGGKEGGIKMDSEGFKIPPPPKFQSNTESQGDQGRVAHLASFKNKREDTEEEFLPERKKQKVEDDLSHGQTVKHNPWKDDKTVFLSNLSYSLEEDRIKEIFSQVGQVTDIRLVRDYKGRSKGYCYVEFATREEGEKALEKDREIIEGRPVFVSRCEDKRNNPSGQKFKFGIGLEKNKLFVKGLPFSTTKEELETLFEQYGTLKEVRLVTYRNGHSKGLAYVEFQDETAAAAALLKTDGMKVNDQIISVAISNPPERRPKKDMSNNVTVSLSLGGGNVDLGPRGRGRTQVTLLPRAVQRTQVVTKQSSANGHDSVQNGENVPSSEDKKLSNDDFRSMLLKK